MKILRRVLVALVVIVFGFLGIRYYVQRFVPIEFGPVVTPEEVAELLADLDENFTEEQIMKTFKAFGGHFLLFSSEGQRELVNESYVGLVSTFHISPRMYNPGNDQTSATGYEFVSRTSMFPLLETSVKVVPEGIDIWFWSQDFISNDERLTQETIDRESVYRLYHGFTPKKEFLAASVSVLNLDIVGDPFQRAFFVMEIVREQKSPPVLGLLE